MRLTPKNPVTTKLHLVTLADMLSASSATANHFALRKMSATLAAPAPAGDAAPSPDSNSNSNSVPPQSLFSMLQNEKSAPSSTSIAAVSQSDMSDAGLMQQLKDVMMLTSFISVAASQYAYQTTYKDTKPDITTPEGASLFVKTMANAKNYILTSAMAGFLSSESLVARSYDQTTTSADLHLGFLSTLFDGFNFPAATIKELDAVLTQTTSTLDSLKLSWSDQSSTLDHMIFLYYFDSVQGIDAKVAKVRIYFLHIDQSSWTASVAKSSVEHVAFHMNFSDGIYDMDESQVAQNRDGIQSLLTNLTGKSLDDLNQLLSPTVVHTDSSSSTNSGSGSGS